MNIPRLSASANEWNPSQKQHPAGAGRVEWGAALAWIVVATTMYLQLS